MAAAVLAQSSDYVSIQNPMYRVYPEVLGQNGQGVCKAHCQMMLMAAHACPATFDSNCKRVMAMWLHLTLMCSRAM